MAARSTWLLLLFLDKKEHTGCQLSRDSGHPRELKKVSVMALSAYENYFHKWTPKKNGVDVHLLESWAVVNYVDKNSNCSNSLLMSNFKTHAKEQA